MIVNKYNVQEMSMMDNYDKSSKTKNNAKKKKNSKLLEKLCQVMEQVFHYIF